MRSNSSIKRIARLIMMFLVSIILVLLISIVIENKEPRSNKGHHPSRTTMEQTSGNIQERTDNQHNKCCCSKSK